MQSIFQLIILILDIYWWIIIAAVVLSWLIAFNIINTNNDIVRQIRYALFRLTEPVLAPIRRILPDLGSIDITPIIVLIAIHVLTNILLPNIYANLAR